MLLFQDFGFSLKGLKREGTVSLEAGLRLHLLTSRNATPSLTVTPVAGVSHPCMRKFAVERCMEQVEYYI